MEKKLVDLVKDFKQELISLSYAESTQKNYCYVLDVLVRYSLKENIDYFSEEIGIRFLSEVYGITDTINFSRLRQSEKNKVRVVRRLSEFLIYGTIIKTHIRMRILLISSNYYKNLLLNFHKYCEEDKQYTDKVVINYERFIERFLGFLEKQNIFSFKKLNIELIDIYIETLTGYTRGTMSYHLSALRVFMKYLFLKDLLTHDLSNKIPLPAQRKLANIPAIWKKADIKKLLEAVDRANPVGKRNYAILLMVTRLGIRTCDIRTLKICDINWQDNRINFIQRKTNKPLSLPLPRDVGWAVLEYLKDGRPKVESPYLFLKHIPPFEHFTNSNFSYDIIRKYMLIANISTEMGAKRVGLHALRHSLAVTLLEKNTPLPIISEILGHASINSTSPYLKVDVPMLRQCALNFEEM